MKPLLKDLRKEEFKNVYGERFIIYSNGVVVYMSGDEVNRTVGKSFKSEDGVINLFNPVFSIWSPEELYKLGIDLQKISGWEPAKEENEK